MNELTTSLLVLGTEIGIVVGIVLLVILAIFIRKRGKEKNIASEFADKFQEFSDTRKDNLGKIVNQSLGNNDEAEAVVNNILSKERTICSHVLKIFKGKDKSLLLNLHEDITRLSDSYRALAEMKAPETGSAPSADVETLEKKIKVLNEENERLKEDLKKSLESIDYLQEQYTTLFKKTEGQAD